MTSSFTQNLTLEKPGNGDYNNTWNVPLNSDWDIVDQAVGGRAIINVVGASGIVSLADTTYRNRIITLSGALTSNVNYRLPSGVGGIWCVYNNTSGSFSITFSSGGGGSTLVVPQGYTSIVLCDGTNVGNALTAPVTLATNATNATNWGGGNLTSNVTWNTAVNIIVPGESSFDVASGGAWSVYDSPASLPMISATAGAQVSIGQAGSRGLYVYGAITATSNITAYSDARLKTDLVRIDSALDKIEKLAGYTYTRIDNGERQTGLIAQDVQAVLPEAVVEGEHLSLAYGNLAGLFVEAIKELRAEVAELRQQAVKVIKP